VRQQQHDQFLYCCRLVKFMDIAIILFFMGICLEVLEVWNQNQPMKLAHS
jgi:NTP pyrophosphatase (non-canonical NTP hydrolase)